MDIARAFGFVFEDERWVAKVLLGGVIFLIPIVGQIVIVGYMLKVAQNVAQGVARPLPEWSEFGDHLARGFYGFIIQLVYLLPAIVLYFLFFIIVTLAGAAASSDSTGNSSAGGAIGVLSLCLLPIIFVLGFVGLVAAYAAIARYLATGVLSEAFKFGEVIANLRANIGTWVMFFIVTILAGIAAQLGLIACGIGVLFTAAYGQFVTGHALGQALRLTGLAPTPLPGTYDPPPPYTPPTF